MHFARFGEHYVLRLEPDEEVMATLARFVENEEIRGGYFLAFGAFCRARLRYFDYARKEYRDFEIDHQVEAVSLLGNIARERGRPMLHLHAALGDVDGRTYSGHVGEAVVRPTLEVFLTRFSGEVCREHDATTGLELLALPEAAPST